MAKDNLVLLVEDDADTREVMALLLDAAGYRVLTARDAKAGIQLMDEQPGIDVIVTDVNIGGGQDGISMAEELRRRGSTAAVVVISGDPEASSERLGPTATFLPKRYDRKALLAAIADARAKNARACAVADESRPPYPGLSHCPVEVASVEAGQPERGRAAAATLLPGKRLPMTSSWTAVARCLLCKDGGVETSGSNSYQLLVQSILDYAIFLVDPQGRIRSWNAGAEQIHGHRAADIVGRPFSLLHTEAERAGGRPELILHMAAAHGRFQEEAERLRRDGSRFWAHVVCDAVRDEHGHLLGFAMVTRDITERRLTEQRLREVERRFRLFVDGVTDCAICMLDANGIVTDWNAGAERIKGYAAGEIIGRPLSLFFVNPLVAQTAMTVASESGRYDVVDWQVRKDGSRFMAEIAIDAIRDNDGQLLGFAKITRDITARVEAERHLEDTRAQLFQSQKIERSEERRVGKECRARWAP